MGWLAVLAAIVVALQMLAATPSAAAPTEPARRSRPLALTVMPYTPTPRPTPTTVVIDGVPVPPGAVLVTPTPTE